MSEISWLGLSHSESVGICLPATQSHRRRWGHGSRDGDNCNLWLCDFLHHSSSSLYQCFCYKYPRPSVAHTVLPNTYFSSLRLNKTVAKFPTSATEVKQALVLTAASNRINAENSLQVNDCWCLLLRLKRYLVADIHTSEQKVFKVRNL